MPLAALLVACGPITLLGGCAAGRASAQGQVERVGDESALTVVGDWDDVAAAGIVAASQAEMAILETEPGEVMTVFRMQTVGGGGGTMTAQRLQPQAEGHGEKRASEPIRLTARIGLFGNPDAEQRLLLAMARRLRQLAGRDYAPL